MFNTATIQKLMSSLAISYDQASKLYWYLVEGYSTPQALRLIGANHAVDSSVVCNSVLDSILSASSLD